MSNEMSLPSVLRTPEFSISPASLLSSLLVMQLEAKALERILICNEKDRDTEGEQKGERSWKKRDGEEGRGEREGRIGGERRETISFRNVNEPAATSNESSPASSCLFFLFPPLSSPPLFLSVFLGLFFIPTR